MARGSESKQFVVKKILETFPGAFQYDKELRIPLQEGGEEIQIKVTLTAAKTNVSAGANLEIPNPASATVDTSSKDITQEEKNQVLDLVTRLGL